MLHLQYTASERQARAQRSACGALVSRMEFSLRIFATPLGEDYYTDDLLLENFKLGYSAKTATTMYGFPRTHQYEIAHWSLADAF